MVQKPPLKGGGDVGYACFELTRLFLSQRKNTLEAGTPTLVVFVISRQEYALFVAGLIQLRSIQTLALRLIDARVGD